MEDEPVVTKTLGGRVVSSALVVWITPKWVLASTKRMGAPCGPRIGAAADLLIMANDLVGRTMRLLSGR